MQVLTVKMVGVIFLLLGSENLGFLNAKLSTFAVWYIEMRSAFFFQSGTSNK